MRASDRETLLTALERLGSADDADALAAAREVHATVAALGLDWDEILQPAAPAPAGAGEAGPAPAAAPAAAPAGDDAALIARLLARPDLAAETREELAEFQRELAAGSLAEMDRSYVRALAARLGG